MQQIEVGDVVVLKSGGPKMTVYSIEGDKITCTWFNNGKVDYNEFPKAALETPADPIF